MRVYAHTRMKAIPDGRLLAPRAYATVYGRAHKREWQS